MPGGKFTSIEKREWYSGGFFVMCQSEGTGPIGPGTASPSHGTRSERKGYTYHEFTSTGEAIDSQGTVNGGTWKWTAESQMGDAKLSVRVTIKQVSKAEDTSKLEMSQNGGEFALVEETKGHKVTAATPAKKS
jgi:hypothetical protein